MEVRQSRNKGQNITEQLKNPLLGWGHGNIYKVHFHNTIDALL